MHACRFVCLCACEHAQPRLHLSGPDCLPRLSLLDLDDLPDGRALFDVLTKAAGYPSPRARRFSFTESFQRISQEAQIHVRTLSFFAFCEVLATQYSWPAAFSHDAHASGLKLTLRTQMCR